VNAEQRGKIVAFERVLNQFILINPTTPLQDAVAFHHVCLNPGLGVTKLGTASGVPKATASRHVKALAGVGPGAHIPALVTRGTGRDERTKALLLTEEGQRVLDQIVGGAGQEGVHVAVPKKNCPRSRRSSNGGRLANWLAAHYLLTG